MKNIVIYVCTIALFFLASCNHHEEEKEEKTEFLVTNPIKMDTTISKEYVCQIKAIQHIEIRALEKGYIQKVYVDEGQNVKSGQLMFQIMPAIFEAETQKASAEVEYAEIEYENTMKLFESNVVSKNEVALMKAKLNKAKAEFSLANAHLSFTKIIAPFDGIMDRFNVRLGSLVDEGDLLTSLSDNSKMWVYFNVPEAEYLNYKMNFDKNHQPNVGLMMANNVLFKYPGIVQTIEADFNNETGNIDFRAVFQNPDKLLRHGETGKILMPVPFKNAIIIPQKATIEILEKRYVFVVKKDNTIEQREIKIASELPDLYILLSGVDVGEKILLEGVRKVKNGDKIDYKYIDPKVMMKDLKVYVE